MESGEAFWRKIAGPRLHPSPPPPLQDRAKLEGDRRKAEVKKVEDDRRAKAAEVAGQRAAAEEEKRQRDEVVRRRKAEEEARKKDAEKQARVSADRLLPKYQKGRRMRSRKQRMSHLYVDVLFALAE